jgi:hypothetical protein
MIVDPQRFISAWSFIESDVPGFVQGVILPLFALTADEVASFSDNPAGFVVGCHTTATNHEDMRSDGAALMYRLAKEGTRISSRRRASRLPKRSILSSHREVDHPQARTSSAPSCSSRSSPGRRTCRTRAECVSFSPLFPHFLNAMMQSNGPPH